MSRREDLHKLVKEEMVVTDGFDMLDDGQKIGPLFIATQAALTENNKARVYVYVEKFDEVSGIGRNDTKIVVARILPYLMIRPARETNMQHGLRKDIVLTQSTNQRR